MDNIDPLIECPYNKSHHILASRMQYHIVKCQKSNPMAEKETCPFDATHRVPKPEFQYHLTVCPNRKVLETHKYQLESETGHGDLALAPYHHTNLPKSSENWDDDPPVPPYQPHLNENKSAFRSIAGATKSERKNFRLAERRRVQQMNDSGHLDNGQGSSKDVADDIDRPLRVPNMPSQALQNLRSMNPSMGLGRGSISPGSSKDVADDIDRPLRVPNMPSQATQSLRAMNPSMGLGRGSISLTGDEAASSLANRLSTIGISTDPLSSLPLGLGRGAIRKQNGI